MTKESVRDTAKKLLVLDIGGTFVKIYATARERLEIPSGPTMTPRQFVRAVKKATDGWQYDAIFDRLSRTGFGGKATERSS